MKDKGSEGQASNSPKRPQAEPPLQEGRAQRKLSGRPMEGRGSKQIRESEQPALGPAVCCDFGRVTSL